jgi:dihydrofolate reductase
MKTQRKIIIYIATSADGYIARPEDDVEWLNRRPRNVDYGMRSFYASFLDAGEIDEFDIHVVPTFIGEGIPLVAPRHQDVPLLLRSARKYPDGVVRRRYDVAR